MRAKCAAWNTISLMAGRDGSLLSCFHKLTAGDLTDCHLLLAHPRQAVRTIG